MGTWPLIDKLSFSIDCALPIVNMILVDFSLPNYSVPQLAIILYAGRIYSFKIKTEIPPTMYRSWGANFGNS